MKQWRDNVPLGIGLAALSAVAAAPSRAQTTTAATASPAAVGGGEETGSDIIVTGSRIVRDGSAAPTPVTAVTAEALVQTAPSNIPDALNKLPQFLNSASPSYSQTFSATAGAQGNYLNLRGLGNTRALILLDGVRVPPTNSTNGVDVNTLPQLLVQRVDVVTGGASAVYGSDAVTGVVNFVLDKNFNGVKGVAQRGISTYGDNPSYRVGLAVGSSLFGGRGHIEASAEQYDSAGILQNARKNGSSQIITVGLGPATSPFSIASGVRYRDLTFGGLVVAGPLAGSKFEPNGTTTPFVPGTATGSPTLTVGGDGAFIPSTTALVSALKTQQAFGRFSFDITDDIKFYTQATWARSRNSFAFNYSARRANSANSITIFADNPYLRPEVRARLGTTPSFQLNKIARDFPVNEVNSVTKSINAQAGLEGSLGAWKWSVDYVYGRAQLDFASYEQNSRKFYAAVDAVTDAGGNIVCGVTLRNPSLVPGCVPINLLGEGNISQAAINFIRDASRYQTINQLNLVSANLSGRLFDLWDGPVTIAVGGEARWQKLTQTTNSDPTAVIDYTGIRGVPTTTLPHVSTNVGTAFGKVNVKEFYGELLVPLARNRPFLQNLELSLAGRATDYSTSGSVKTWKVGVNWSPVPDLRFRGTVSRDIAAPSLFQLFAGRQNQFLLFNDVHTGVDGVWNQETAGNPALVPERATTLVGGAVFTPRFIPGLTLSVDAYRILIKDAFATTDSRTEIADCEASNGTAAVCALVIRPLPFSDRSAANFPTKVIVAPQNLSLRLLKGIDFEASYRRPLWSGTIDLRAFATYTPVNNSQLAAGAAVQKRAGGPIGAQALGGGNPIWRGTLSQGFEQGGFSIRLTERFTGTYRRSFYPTQIYLDHDKAPNRTYTDLFLSKTLTGLGGLTPFLQIQNLFNVQPPLLGSDFNPGLQYPTDKAYDVIGRYFTFGVRFKF